MKRSFIFALVALATSVSSVHAIDLTFKFDVLSSGPALYACNAGIRHTPPGDKVCYILGTQTACNPGGCALGDEACINNCVCTGLEGATRIDFLVAKHGPWDGAPTAKATVQAGTSAFNTVFTDAASWENRLDTLTFDLGSERYGAAYFVDICFRGSQIEYFESQVVASNYLQAQVSVSDFSVGSGLKYSDLSDLAVQVQWGCDLQGAGNLQYARNGSNHYDSSVNEVSLTGGDRHGSSAYQSVGPGTMSMVDAWINTNSQAPRFCKVRYLFSETAVNSLRKWQLHGAQVCTYTRIEEPEFLGDGPIQ